MKWQQQQVAEIQIKADEAEQGIAEQRTVGHYLRTHWDAVHHNLAPTTWATDESTLRVHILSDDLFCGLDYYDLTPADLQAFLGRINGSENAKATVYKLLHSAFQTAVEERVLATNPIFIAKNKKPRRSKSKVEAMAPEDEADLLLYALAHPEDPMAPIVLFSLDTGCRQGEMLALQFDCVDFGRSELTIRRTLLTLKGGKTVLRDTLKTAGSLRTIKVVEIVPWTH